MQVKTEWRMWAKAVSTVAFRKEATLQMYDEKRSFLQSVTNLGKAHALTPIKSKIYIYFFFLVYFTFNLKF